MGYHVKLGASATAEGTYLAGTDAVRAKDMNDFFADDSVKAILCLRGGYGSARLLGLLDYDTIAKHPKLFIGYSDITALHTVLGERCQLVTVHGPMLTSLTLRQPIRSISSKKVWSGQALPETCPCRQAIP